MVICKINQQFCQHIRLCENAKIIIPCAYICCNQRDYYINKDNSCHLYVPFQD
jgi:hypothetical protein